MITNENWIDFCCTFFGISDPKWLKHVTDNWITITNKTGCGCEFWHKCDYWRQLNPEPLVEDDAEVPTYAELSEPRVNLEDFAYRGPLVDDLYPSVDDPFPGEVYIEAELPKEIESK